MELRNDRWLALSLTSDFHIEQGICALSPQSLSILPWMMCMLPGAIDLDLSATDPVFLASLTATLIVHVLHHRSLQRRLADDGGPLSGAMIGGLFVLIWFASQVFEFELRGRGGSTLDPGLLLPTGVLQLCFAGARWVWTEATSRF